MNIAEGLKVLPVNVMACKQMLVLCGTTYPERIWCAWELCTMFSFMRIEAALERIVLFPVDDGTDTRSSGLRRGSSSQMAGLRKLERFDILKSHCYDPNEEKVLRRIIKTVGVEYFNARLRSLAKGVSVMDSMSGMSRSRKRPAI